MVAVIVIPHAGKMETRGSRDQPQPGENGYTHEVSYIQPEVRHFSTGIDCRFKKKPYLSNTILTLSLNSDLQSVESTQLHVVGCYFINKSLTGWVSATLL